MSDSEIDWDNLLDNFDDFSPSPDDSSGCLLSIEDVEQYLLNEDGDDDDDFNLQQNNNVWTDEFFSDLLINSPPEDDEKEEEDNAVVVVDDDNTNTADDDDPAAKKRKRQMRNRDAAVRSRERKKSYVRDLEMKSKYYEAECKRLGILFQCCVAENQALRLSLHNTKAFDASMTKQESAVLLLESLLLGSLLGFLDIICLQILPILLLSTPEVGLLKNVLSVKKGRLVPRKAGNEVFRVPVLRSFMMGKRCRGSRSRMKLIFV